MFKRIRLLHLIIIVMASYLLYSNVGSNLRNVIRINSSNDFYQNLSFRYLLKKKYAVLTYINLEILAST
jgi:hypothetical protein